ncbi:hypothetical protein [Herbidospora mongoliensis]|uniref:hypothetical protein n=1 Tax=Herbidospora mongoliensis TaxID=688067 RepID=UPI00082C0EB1|nr:hypothetical protein [Herbidospora mongoliensis]
MGALRTAAVAAAGLGSGVLAVALVSTPFQPPVPAPPLPPVRMTAAEPPLHDDYPWSMGVHRPPPRTALPAALTGCDEALGWLRRKGAGPVRLFSQPMVINVRALRATNLRIVRVTARIVDREPPPAPPITVECSGGDTFGGGDPFFYEPKLTVGGSTRERFEPSVLRPGESESYTVVVEIPAARKSAFYVLDVDYTLDGKRRLATIDDRGRPFHLARGARDRSFGFTASPRPTFSPS